MRVEVVDRLDALGGHADRWDRLAEASRQRLPLLSHAWLASHLEHMLDPDERWMCALVWEDEQLRGVLPVTVTPHRVWGRWRPYLAGISDGQTRAGDALVSDAGGRDTVSALATALLDAEPKALGIRLPAVREGSPTREAAEAGFGDLAIVRRSKVASSFLETDGPIESFRSRLSSNFKGNLRKSRNKLAKLPDVETTFTTGGPATEARLADFLALEASGWKGEEGTAIGLSPTLVAFYQAVCERLAERDWLEWHELRTEGRLIASHLAARVGGSVSLIKVAFDEDFARCAPGNMLMERCIERAFADEEIRSINCITDQPWHRNWRMPREAVHGFSLFPRGAASSVFGRLPTAVEARARETLRPLRRRVGR